MSNSIDSNIVNPYSAQNKVSDSAKDKPNESKQPSKISAAKAFMCLGATAAAVAGVLLAKNHINGKSLKAAAEEMQSLHNEMRNHLANNDLVEHFGKEQVEKLRAEANKLQRPEQLNELKTLESRSYHAKCVVESISQDAFFPKGMKELPEEVKKAYEAKDLLKTGELMEAELAKIPDARHVPAHGETVEQTIENVFGKNSSIKPHTYDLSKENPVFNAYVSNGGGFKDGVVGKDGLYYADARFCPDEVLAKMITRGDKKRLKFSEPLNIGETGASITEIKDTLTGRKGLELSFKQYSGVKGKVIFASPGKKYTPLQKDLLSFVEHPEKFDNKVIRKIADVPFESEYFDPDKLLLGKDALGHTYPNLDYDLMLSAIQSMAK